MLVCSKRPLESVYAARSPNCLNIRLVLNFMILSILMNIKPSELKSDMFWCFKNKYWASRLAAWTILQSKVFQIWVKHFKNTFHCCHWPEYLFFNQFSWKFLSTEIEIHVCSHSLLHTVLCQLLNPSHVESGGCCGPAYVAGTFWLMAPGDTEVDWAPRGKSQPWADKGFHMSGRVSLSRVPACFLLCRKVFSDHRCDGKLINSTSGESVFPILSQNQQSLCSGLAAGKW